MKINEHRVYLAFRLKITFSQFHVYGDALGTGEDYVSSLMDVHSHSEKTYPIFDKQRYFPVLAMQEGVNWTAGNMKGVHSDSMTMDVDWIRVWQK